MSLQDDLTAAEAEVTRIQSEIEAATKAGWIATIEVKIAALADDVDAEVKSAWANIKAKL